MFNKTKRAIKYIRSGVPEYNINVSTAYFDNDTYLKDKIVLITGGNKGIGYSIAKRVIEGGGKAIITGRNKNDLDTAKEQLGENLYAYVLDNNNPEKFDSFIKKIDKEVGEINCLVNNAGVSFHEKSFEEVTIKGFDEQININLRGTYFMCQSYINYYKSKKMKSGVILNIASETANQPMYRPYGMSKSAIVSFTRWLAKTYITEGIRANAVAPGVTESNMTNHYTKGKIYNEGAVGKRTINPNEIAETCCFLLSDASRCISGQVIACNEANVFFDN